MGEETEIITTEHKILDKNRNSPSGEKKTQTKAIIYLIIASVCWAMPPALGKLMNGEIPSPVIAWFRLLFASLLLSIIFLPIKKNRTEFKQTWKLSAKDKLILVIGALFEGIHYVLYFEALKYTTSLNVGILINVGEITVALAGPLFFREKFTKKMSFSVVIAFLGILMIMIGDNFLNLLGLFNSETLIGDLMMIGSALLFTGYAITKKKLIPKTGPVPMVVIPFFIGSILLLPLVGQDLQYLGTYSSTSWGLLLLISIFGSAIGYYFFALALKYTTMSKAGIFTLVSPIFAVIFSQILVPGEIVTAGFVAGTVLIISSIVLISK